MRLNKLVNLFSFSKYRQLRQDFLNPLTALLASSGIGKKRFTLIDGTGQPYYTTRSDTVLWNEYFRQEHCKIVPEQGRFKVIPHNTQHPSYLIEGCHQGFTYQPRRWNKELYNSPLAKQLEESERRVFSQHGEDGVIEYLFNHIPTEDPTIIEFGAYDGIEMSNSRNLIRNHNWRALLIEADSRFYKSLEMLYRDHPRVHILKSMVTPENINQLFSAYSIDKKFDVLSIDIDSIDYFVWEALTAFTPKLVVIEFNSTLLPNIEYIVEPDKAAEYSGTSREGASILSLYKLGIRKGYELVYSELHGANLFFLHQDYLKYFDYRPLTPEALYQPPQFGVLAGGSAPNGRGYR